VSKYLIMLSEVCVSLLAKQGEVSYTWCQPDNRDCWYIYSLLNSSLYY